LCPRRNESTNAYQKREISNRDNSLNIQAFVINFHKLN
jgi:hypothetical protein